MNITNLSARAVLAAAFLVSPVMSHDAHAFGGLWSSGGVVLEQSAARIVFVDNPDSTITAIVQLEYRGPARHFAWLIPVPGTPTVGISSSTVFQRLDAATAPQYWVEVGGQQMCLPQDAGSGADDVSAPIEEPPRALNPSPSPVIVLDRGSVGSYDYVTIGLDAGLSNRSQVAIDWLTTQGYDLNGVESPTLDPYLSGGLSLLAFKLTEGADAGAIRPVILTYESPRPILPIRPTAVAAQQDMRVQIWVVGRSQAVPVNYKSLVLNDALINWLSGAKYIAGTLPAGGVGPAGPSVVKPSNYDAVVSAAADEAGGHGFVTELGGPASRYRPEVWSDLDEQTLERITSQTYKDGIDAIFAASGNYADWDGWKDAVIGATTLPDDVTIEAFGRDPERYRGEVVVDTAEFFRLLRERVVAPVADTAALLYRAPYLTRLYTTMSPEEMNIDPMFDYNADLAQVDNIHVARQSLTCSPTQRRSDARWQIDLPQGGAIAGTGDEAWPVPAGSMPANLKVVMLSTSGSGTLVEDNSQAIGTTLWEAAGEIGSGAPTLHSPQHGLMIGGTQSVTPQRRSAPSNACSASQVGAGASRLPALGLLLALYMFARRARGTQG